MSARASAQPLIAALDEHVDGVSHPTGVAVSEDVARQLCEGCPTGAISIVDAAE